MKPTHTSIAVALAVIVVAAFFVVPQYWPFGAPVSASETPTPESATTTAIQASSTTPMTTNEGAPTVTTASGLQITDEVVGTGPVAEKGDTVTVKYVGAFADGTVFDASANHPETANGFTFTIGGNVIAGWNEGVVGMKVGGTRKLVVPPALGYGSQDYGPIPGNSVLNFEIELLSVQKAGH
jgi:peptidylprolyl isomerase